LPGGFDHWRSFSRPNVSITLHSKFLASVASRFSFCAKYQHKILRSGIDWKCVLKLHARVNIPSHLTRRILQVIHPVFARFTDFLLLLVFSVAAVVSISGSLQFLLRVDFQRHTEMTKEKNLGKLVSFNKSNLHAKHQPK
jgi:hypothetical protein